MQIYCRHAAAGRSARLGNAGAQVAMGAQRRRGPPSRGLRKRSCRCQEPVQSRCQPSAVQAVWCRSASSERRNSPFRRPRPADARTRGGPTAPAECRVLSTARTTGGQIATRRVPEGSTVASRTKDAPPETLQARSGGCSKPSGTTGWTVRISSGHAPGIAKKIDKSRQWIHQRIKGDKGFPSPVCEITERQSLVAAG